jgi:hypothetical protein
MIQMLRRGWECVRQCRERRAQKLTAGDPTRIRVEIADDEGCGLLAFYSRELPSLVHTDGLRMAPKLLAKEFIIGLSVGVDQTEHRAAIATLKFYPKPAFGCELIQARCAEVRILSGIHECPGRRGPGEGETGAEKSRNVRLTGGAKEYPTCGSEGG